MREKGYTDSSKIYIFLVKNLRTHYKNTNKTVNHLILSVTKYFYRVKDTIK